MAESTPEDRMAAERALRSYADAFARGDAAAAGRCCQAPLLWVTAERVTLAASPEEVERTFSGVLQALRARGFSRAEFVELHVRMLGPGLALASGSAIRYAGNAELERIGATYLLRQIQGEWRIVTLAAHAPEAILRELGAG